MPNRPSEATLLHATVLADFNAANFAAYLQADAAAPRLAVSVSPYGQLSLATSDPPVDVAIVWTQPHAVSPTFARLVDGEPASLVSVLGEVDDFAEQLRQLRERVGHLVVVGWQPPPIAQTFASLSMREHGVGNVVMRMNLRLAEHLEAIAGAILLDPAAWRTPERTPEEAKLWFAAKIPHRAEVFKRAARTVKTSLAAARGASRKVIVLDLDDTLWGGLVGEVGTAGLRLGGHDAIGEAYVAFQRAVKRLKARGLLLAIASKNNEAVALDAIASHPEMVLRPADFAGWKINWNDKAGNIAALAEELNLGLQSLVFLDDSPIERARVRETLPEVLVPEWPTSPLLYEEALLSLGCFDTVAITAEDRTRSDLYAAERERIDQRGTLSLDQWLARLELTVDADELNEQNLPRAVQLLNKTNQMNLSTRRLDAQQLVGWLREGRRQFWTFRVRDRFGDAGLTGLASVSVEGSDALVTDFVLSCRVFGRRVESAMLHTVATWARGAHATRLVASLVPTAKNGPTRTFLEQSGLRVETDTRFTWDLATPYPLPDGLSLRLETGVSA